MQPCKRSTKKRIRIGIQSKDNYNSRIQNVLKGTSDILHVILSPRQLLLDSCRRTLDWNRWIVALLTSSVLLRKRPRIFVATYSVQAVNKLSPKADSIDIGSTLVIVSSNENNLFAWETSAFQRNDVFSHYCVYRRHSYGGPAQSYGIMLWCKQKSNEIWTTNPFCLRNISAPTTERIFHYCVYGRHSYGGPGRRCSIMSWSKHSSNETWTTVT
jgi:hypothetical protein